MRPTHEWAFALVLALALGATAALWGAGCSDDDAAACEPGDERTCQCDGGVDPGVQQCASNGEWGPCEQCSAQTCGDGTCDPGEDAASCPQDCDGPVCGDGTCDPDEDATSCPQDCEGPYCGDGTCDPGEDDVSCPADCESPCGDGHVTAGEACDASNLNGHDCTTLGQGFSGGTLACASDCTFDTSGCVSTPGCGNHVKEGTEACDGDDFGGQTCADLDPAFTGGRLACRPDCSAILTRGCHAIAPCGDGTAQWPEECDGADLQGLSSCTDFDPGYSGGALSCTEHCTLDFSACQGDLCAAAGMYGTGYCDPCVLYGGTPDPDCQSCTQSDGDCVSWMAPGMGDVLTSCEQVSGQQDPDCGTCGDGQVNPATEWCDVALGVPAGPQCSDFGFTGGELGCTAACVLDVSGCTD